jgi:hypothetical protein
MQEHETSGRTGSSSQAEARMLDRLRKDYESQGYQILDRLPVERTGVLGAYRPDLVAKKGKEVIIVELKNSVETRESADLRALRDLVESHPGWHFRILLVGDSDQGGPGAKPRDRTVVDHSKRLARARTVWQRGDLEGGLTLLWIAVEGALRSYFSKNRETPNKGVTALSMLRSLRDEGVVDDKELRSLADGYEARNQAVHGFKVRLSKESMGRLFKTASGLVTRLSKA